MVWRMLLVVVVLVSGCTSLRKATFPIGLYDVPEEDLSTVAEAGFTHVEGRKVDEGYLDYAESLGLSVLPFGIGKDEEAITTAVKSYDHHPALWGWYILDEPDLNNIPVEKVEALNTTYKKAGAKNPTVLVLMDSSRTKEFAHCSDILMLDHYPVPWAPVSRFAYEMEKAREAKNGPFLGIIQAFDWKHFPGLIETTNEFRAPTYEELRCMTYMAGAAGVDGIFYYTYQAKSWRIREHQTWGALTNVVQEVNRVRPLFTADQVSAPLEVTYKNSEQEWNEMNRPGLTVRGLRTKRSAAKLSRGEYVLCINTLGRKLPVVLEIAEGRAVREFEPEGTLGEEQKGRRAMTFQPYEVRIYKVEGPGKQGGDGAAEQYRRKGLKGGEILSLPNAAGG